MEDVVKFCKFVLTVMVQEKLCAETVMGLEKSKTRYMRISKVVVLISFILLATGCAYRHSFDSLIKSRIRKVFAC